MVCLALVAPKQQPFDIRYVSGCGCALTHDTSEKSETIFCKPWPSNSWLARAAALLIALDAEASVRIAAAQQARSCDGGAVPWSWVVARQANL